MQNQGFKKILLFLVVGFFLLFIFLFFSRRYSISGIIESSVVFKKKNEALIDSVSFFLKNNGIINCDKTIINFYWRKQYVDILCNDSANSIAKKVATPAFIKSFFLDNDGNSLLVSNDGILFYTLYHSYKFKKFSIKYFFNPHKLKENEMYMDKYKVVDVKDIGNYKLACSAIDDHWLLIEKDE